MKTLGFDPDPKEVHKMMQLADVDGNGTLDFDEFCQLVRSCTPTKAPRGWYARGRASLETGSQVGPRMGEKEAPSSIRKGFELLAGRAARAGIPGATNTGNITIDDLRQVCSAPALPLFPESPRCAARSRRRPLRRERA